MFLPTTILIKLHHLLHSMTVFNITHPPYFFNMFIIIRFYLIIQQKKASSFKFLVIVFVWFLLLQQLTKCLVYLKFPVYLMGMKKQYPLKMKYCSPWLLFTHQLRLKFQSLKPFHQIYQIWSQWQNFIFFFFLVCNSFFRQIICFSIISLLSFKINFSLFFQNRRFLAFPISINS